MAQVAEFSKKYALPDEERAGLSNDAADEIRLRVGANELEVPETSIVMLIAAQFYGTMPNMLWIAMIISFAVVDLLDGFIILFMLLVNGILSSHEELKCLEAMNELTQKMEAKVTVQRDGFGHSLNVRELVPGDIIMLLGGLVVPADVDWIEGDILGVDTAAMTGEPIPRKYPSHEYGQRIESGCTIVSGEAYGVVRNTGKNTEIGRAQESVLADKAGGKQLSVFEDKAMKAVQVILTASLFIAIVIFLLQGIKHNEFTETAYRKDLLTVLSIIVASIPIALPIVLTVTMALGASKMATEYHAAITNIPALQDIASMSVLCSDKTGTLTTAKMNINHNMVWCDTKFTKKEVGLYAMLASSRDKKEDAVDRCVVKYFDSIYKDAGAEMTAGYDKIGGMGFNPIYKRVVVELKHPTKGTIKVAKGLATKVLDTADGSKDDADEQWVCSDFDRLKSVVAAKDKELSNVGYKTIGVAIKVNDEPWAFVGILPMMDPPRPDSPATIANLVAAGVRVKMITGDHLNIAIETARQLGMGMARSGNKAVVNIYAGEAVRGGTQTSKQLIEDADGFAQVLPSDKREVVEVLKKDFGYVVGMTGDGVNDAPALSAAQCGIAVDDATDAAKNAAKILLTSEGLSAVYSAVVESRKIFRKLKAYITYRFAASIQIVLVLSILIFASDCPINPTYVIALALMNDLTMLPIAYDNQMAGSLPEVPNVNYILLTSCALGFCETVFSLIFAYGVHPTGMFNSRVLIGECEYDGVNPDNAPASSKTIQAAIWLQMFISAEILIFSARAPSHFLLFMPPSIALTSFVGAGILLACVVCNTSPYFGALPGIDIFLIALYCILCLFIIDFVKVKILQFLDENLEVLPEEEIKPTPQVEMVDEDDLELKKKNEEYKNINESMTMRQSIAVDRMTNRAISTNERLSQLDPSTARKSLIQQQSSRASRSGNSTTASDRLSTASGVLNSSMSGDLRHSLLNTSASLRPNTPATAALRK